MVDLTTAAALVAAGVVVLLVVTAIFSFGGSSASAEAESGKTRVRVFMVCNGEAEAAKAIFSAFDSAREPGRVLVSCAVMTGQAGGCEDRVRDKVRSLAVAGSLGAALTRERFEETKVSVFPVTVADFRGSLHAMALMAQDRNSDGDVFVFHPRMNRTELLDAWDTTVCRSEADVLTSSLGAPSFLCWGSGGYQVRPMAGKRGIDVPSCGIFFDCFSGGEELKKVVASLAVSSEGVLDGTAPLSLAALMSGLEPVVTFRPWATAVGSPHACADSVVAKSEGPCFLRGRQEEKRSAERISSTSTAHMGLTPRPSDEEILAKYGSGRAFMQEASTLWKP